MPTYSFGVEITPEDFREEEMESNHKDAMHEYNMRTDHEYFLNHLDYSLDITNTLTHLKHLCDTYGHSFEDTLTTVTANCP